MKKIAYIEIDTHAEIAKYFMEMMKDSTNFSVDYYFSKKIISQLEIPNSINVLETSPKNLLSLLSQKQYDLVIIGTVHRYFNVFDKIVEKFITSIICHNLNFVKASNIEFLQNILKKDIAFRMKLLCKEGLLLKNKVYQNAKNLLVLDENLSSGNFQFFPIFSTQCYTPIENITYTIVVPGTVSQNRRDYKGILEKLNQFSIKSDYRIVLLGKAEGEELKWIEDYEKNKKSNISLIYFTEKVPQTVFDEWMKTANVLWCPLQTKTEFLSVPEFYETSKMSGNIGDAIRFGKMAIFPTNSVLNHEFIITEKQNIEQQIVAIQQDFDFQKKYSQAKVREKLESLLESISL